MPHPYSVPVTLVSIYDVPRWCAFATGVRGRRSDRTGGERAELVILVNLSLSESGVKTLDPYCYRIVTYPIPMVSRADEPPSRVYRPHGAYPPTRIGNVAHGPTWAALRPVTRARAA